MTYLARQSEHIEADQARNWSSWNFGALGFEGSKKKLEEAMNESLANDSFFDISGFELWEDDIRNADIRELYKGYWVLVDNVNAAGGLSCIDLDAENLENAMKEARTKDYSGSGQSFDASQAKLVYSNNDIHIFEINY